MKKAHRQERLLSSTLTESLILFLFILLAIADIYQKREKEYKDNGMIPPGHKAVPKETIVIDKNQIGVDKDKYLQLTSKLENSREELKKLKGQKKRFDSLGVSCPPCELPNGNNFILFNIDYLADTIYVMTLKNISKPEIFEISNGKRITLNNNEKIYLKYRDFNRWADGKVASKRINQDDEYCKNGTNSQRQSSYCIECQYVFQRISTKDKLSSKIFNRKKKLIKN